MDDVSSAAHRRRRRSCAAYDEPAAAGVTVAPDPGYHAAVDDRPALVMQPDGALRRSASGGPQPSTPRRRGRVVPAGPTTTWSNAPALSAESRFASHVCAPWRRAACTYPAAG